MAELVKACVTTPGELSSIPEINKVKGEDSCVSGCTNITYHK